MAESVKIIFDAVDNASGTVKKLDNSLHGFVGAITDGMKAAGPYVAVLTSLWGITNKAAQAAGEAEKVQALLNATLESTGKAAEITSEKLSNMATAQMRSSIFDDEAILSATNAILKFGNVATKDIPKVTQMAIDLASALGTDVVNSADQIGRALETGTIPKLWGFSTALKEQIKKQTEAGNEAQALTLIMDELTRRYGGQGIAALTTYTGATEALKNEMGNLAEVGGSQVLPMLTMLKFALADVIVLAQDAAIGMQDTSTSIEDVPLDKLNAALEETKTQLLGATTYSEKYMLSQKALMIQQEINRRSTQGFSIDMGELGGQFSNLNLTVRETADGMDELANEILKVQTNAEKINIIFDVQEQFDTLQEAAKKYHDALGKVMDTITAGGKPNEAELESLQKLETAYDEARAANEKWIKQWLFSMVQQKLASTGEPGLSDAEFAQLLSVGEGLGIIDPEVAAATQKIMDAINSADPKGLDDALRAMQELFDFDGETITTYHQTIELPPGGTTPAQDPQQPTGHQQGFGQSSASDGKWQFFNYGTVVMREPISRRALMDATV